MSYFSNLKNCAMKVGLTAFVVGAIIGHPNAHYGEAAKSSNTPKIAYKATEKRYIDDVVGYIKKHNEVNLKRVRKDVNHLKTIGYDIPVKDLFYLANVVSDEAGLYYDSITNKNKKKELTLTEKGRINLCYDMEGIVRNIFNRYIVSRFDKDGKHILKSSFCNNGDVTIYNVVLKKGQYSAAEQDLWKKSWDKAYKKGILTYNEPRLSKEKADDNLRRLNHERILTAYEVVIGTLEKIAKNPDWDPTQGSLFYKRVEWHTQWDGTNFGGFKKDFTKEIGKHNHYRLIDENGKDIVPEYREQFKKNLKKVHINKKPN